MQQAASKIAGEMETTLVLGPRHPAVPAGMLISLSLEPQPGMLGWGSGIKSAQVETGHGYIGLEESVAGGMEWLQALSLVEGLCGGCAQANALAFAQATESLFNLIVPPRAYYMRMVQVETERIVSHLLNAAQMMEALSLQERGAALLDLREKMLQALQAWSGARIAPGLITIGGVSRNTDETACRALALAARNVERSLRAHVASAINSRDIAARLSGLGTIRVQEAMLGGLRGPTARACGIVIDIRSSYPVGAYEDEAVTIVIQRAGDAFARMAVRLLESLESLRVIEQALDELPPGTVRARGNVELLGTSGTATSRVEGPRGEIFCWVKGDPNGITNLHLSPGSYPAVGVLPGLLTGSKLEDLEPLVLSLDICTGCLER
ncbi:MAG: hypothetical protein M3014_12815 [Chloroflexota bacterium]|nr:hypothetical protein [Chloroflexota bacterium]